MSAKPSASEDIQHDATAAALIDGSDPSTLIGHVIAQRYRVEAVLGEGGMGAVLRCLHLGLRRDVALKVLHPELARNKEIAARFAREAQSASRLDHPNCVRVMDFGEWNPGDGGPAIQYLAMQLLDGHELSEDLGQPLPATRAVDLTVQLLRGLEHAHAEGIVHRDLKPENVFVTRDHEDKEVLKLVDFGIAKIVSGEGAKDGMTRAGLVFGTPRYMSPEQGTGGKIDERTDIYSVGIMLYEMLAGHPPFDSDDPVELVRQQIIDDPPPLPDHVPAALRAIVDRMIAKRREERYADTASVRAALEEVRPGLETTVQPRRDSLRLDSLGQKSLRMATSFAQEAPEVVRRLTLQGQEFARNLEPRRRKMIGIAAGATALLMVLVLAWPDGDEDEAPQAQPSVSGSWLGALTNDEDAKPSVDPDDFPMPPVTAVPGADDGVIAEIDRLLDGGDLKAAATLLNPLIDRYPKDARLLLRRGRLLARARRKRDRNRALAPYAQAVELDPRLLEDEGVRTELLAVMKIPAVREQALDLAVRRLGKHGHPFLLEIVNQDAPVLGFVNRHRALDTLATDPDNLEQINNQLNVALDLWQAGQSPTPCQSFGEALTAIENEPDPYYLGTLHKVKPPQATKGMDPVRAAVCSALPSRLETIRKTLVSEYNIPPNQYQVPAAYKKKRRRGFFGIFR